MVGCVHFLSHSIFCSNRFPSSFAIDTPTMSEPTPLPTEVPFRVQNVAHVKSAYNICRRLESSLMIIYDKLDFKKTAEREVVRMQLVYIRILGYMIHYTPTDRGMKAVVEEISSSMTDDALLACGRHYYDHYIWACKLMNISLI